MDGCFVMVVMPWEFISIEESALLPSPQFVSSRKANMAALYLCGQSPYHTPLIVGHHGPMGRRPLIQLTNRSTLPGSLFPNKQPSGTGTGGGHDGLRDSLLARWAGIDSLDRRAIISPKSIPIGHINGTLNCQDTHHSLTGIIQLTKEKTIALG